MPLFRSWLKWMQRLGMTARPVGVDQQAPDAVLRADQNAARHAQGTVQPGGHDHTAVALGLRLAKTASCRRPAA